MRPTGVYRPVSDVLAEMERESPDIFHPSVVTHPVTGEEILYISEAVVQELVDQHNTLLDDEGDLLIWAHRSLIHPALRVTEPEPAISFRVTVQDGQLVSV